MIDIHNHILPNIDDGSKSFEESINILKQAYESGVTDIIVTPHFILGSSYSSKVKDNETILKELKNKLKLENININLYLGNEIFVENNMLELLKSKSVTSLNKSRYVLFELPMNNNFKGLKDLLFNLQVNGYIPVIAHPERYRFIKENKYLGKNVILLGLAGSYSYGTNNENSDIDVRGVTLNQKSDLIGLTEFEQYVDADTDTTIYSFNKLVTLLLSCNPNTIELLGLNPEHYLYLSDIGQMLFDNRKLFLSKRENGTCIGHLS